MKTVRSGTSRRATGFPRAATSANRNTGHLDDNVNSAVPANKHHKPQSWQARSAFLTATTTVSSGVSVCLFFSVLFFFILLADV